MTDKMTVEQALDFIIETALSGAQTLDDVLPGTGDPVRQAAHVLRKGTDRVKKKIRISVNNCLKCGQINDVDNKFCAECDAVLIGIKHSAFNSIEFAICTEHTELQTVTVRSEPVFEKAGD